MNGREMTRLRNECKSNKRSNTIWATEQTDGLKIQIDAHHQRSKRQFNPKMYKGGEGAIGYQPPIRFFQNIEKKG